MEGADRRYDGLLSRRRFAGWVQSSFHHVLAAEETIISFATGPGTGVLNDAVHSEAIEELTGRSITPPFVYDPQPVAANIAGEYRSFQLRAIAEVKGEELILTGAYEPYDQDHRDFFKDRFSAARFPPVTYHSVAPGQFARAGTEPESYFGLGGRMNLLAILPATANRRMGLMHSWVRYTPKVA